MTVTRLVSAAQPLFSEATELFDLYRQHFGANPAAEAAAEWIRDQVFAERARIYVAGDDGHADGICSVAIVPAALTLRTVWLIRDLYVLPAARHRGIARSLIEQVAVDARAGGAHRLSLQTEAGNVRAVELYTRNDFTAESDLVVMERVL
jgi:GNAT superfamily N-acetyltransferase